MLSDDIIVFVVIATIGLALLSGYLVYSIIESNGDCNEKD